MKKSSAQKETKQRMDNKKISPLKEASNKKKKVDNESEKKVKKEIEGSNTKKGEGETPKRVKYDRNQVDQFEM